MPRLQIENSRKALALIKILTASGVFWSLISGLGFIGGSILFEYFDASIAQNGILRKIFSVTGRLVFPYLLVVMPLALLIGMYRKFKITENFLSMIWAMRYQFILHALVMLFICFSFFSGVYTA